MTHLLGAQILDLLIDEEDSPRGPGITFGPILLLQEQQQIAAEAAEANNPATPRYVGDRTSMTYMYIHI